MATGNVFLQKPSLPASHKFIIVENQGGFKSSAGIHSVLLPLYPFFRLAAGPRRNGGRKSTPLSGERAPTGRLEKAGAQG
jgi:hypothetical protein